MVALFYYSPEVNCYPKIFIEMNEKCIYQEKVFWDWIKKAFVF
jgi:hypothetical protein